MLRKSFLIIATLCALAISASAQDLGFDGSRPLVIGLDMDYPPLQYIDEKGEPNGHDVEFTRELMQRMGLKYTYAPNTWKNIAGEVLNGRVDLGMMVYSPYRKDIINYSRAVFRMYYQILYRHDMTQNVDLRNLEGKRIAFMSSRPVKDTLTKIGAELYIVENLSQATRDLSEGRYDAVICFRHQAKYLINRNHLTNISARDLTLAPREYCYVSHNRKLIETINAHLDTMEAEGVIDEIYGSEITSSFGTIDIPMWVWGLMALIVMFAAVVIAVLSWSDKQQLRREMQRVQRSERLKTVFLGNVSHALRTPLNAINGFSDMLLKSPDAYTEKEREEMVRQINSNGNKLLYYIDELLQLSDIETNELTFNRHGYDLETAMQEMADKVRPKLQPGVELRVEGDGGRVVADPFLMRTVVIHALNNAAKYTQKGSITLKYYPEKNGLYIEVIDTGVGLPEDLREHLFDMLYEKSAYTRGELTGLGLNICRAIVERAGGKIGARSPKEGGTVMWHWVPVKVISEK